MNILAHWFHKAESHLGCLSRIRHAAFFIALICVAFPVHAVTISVLPGVVEAVDDGQCSLIEAINNANSDSQQFTSGGECAGGFEEDVIDLPADSLFTLTAVDNSAGSNINGLPIITSAIEILGNGSVIERSTATETAVFRLMHVIGPGELTIRNVTLRHGESGRGGGAIYGVDASLSLDRVVVSNNRGRGVHGQDISFGMVDSQVINNHGGGLYLNLTGDLAEGENVVIVISRSSISGNLVRSGSGLAGGIWIAGPGPGPERVTLVLEDSTVFWNRADGIGSPLETSYSRGGGVYVKEATLQTNRTNIAGNSSTLGGGVYLHSLEAAYLESSWLRQNEAFSNGGGLFSSGSVVEIHRSKVSRNSALGRVNDGTCCGGGGVYHRRPNSVSGNLTIRQSSFVGNKSHFQGGGVYFWTHDIIIENSTFSDNMAPSGGGAFIDRDTSNAIIVNNTFSGNIGAGGASGLGIMSANGSPNPVVTFVNNVLTYGTGTDCSFRYLEGETNLKNLIEDGSCEAAFSGDPGLNGLQYDDSLFPTPPWRPLHHQATGPLLDLGDNDNCPDFDQLGNARDDGSCDLGSFERVGDSIFQSTWEVDPEPPLPGLFFDLFSPDRSDLWQIINGTWTNTKGLFKTTEPGGYALLPFELTNYVLEADINKITDGGIWVRAVDSSGGPASLIGVLLVTGGLGGTGEGLYWHVDEGDGFGEVLELNNDLALNGTNARIRIEADGNTFRAFVDNNPIPATTLVLTPDQFSMFPGGRVGFYDNSTMQSFDGLFISQ